MTQLFPADEKRKKSGLFACSGFLAEDGASWLPVATGWELPFSGDPAPGVACCW